MLKHFQFILIALMLLMQSSLHAFDGNEHLEQFVTFRRMLSDYYNPWLSFDYRPNAIIPGKYKQTFKS
jgi:hypothetical protein